MVIQHDKQCYSALCIIANQRALERVVLHNCNQVACSADLMKCLSGLFRKHHFVWMGLCGCMLAQEAVEELVAAFFESTADPVTMELFRVHVLPSDLVMASPGSRLFSYASGHALTTAGHGGDRVVHISQEHAEAFGPKKALYLHTILCRSSFGRGLMPYQSFA